MNRSLVFLILTIVNTLYARNHHALDLFFNTQAPINQRLQISVTMPESNLLSSPSNVVFHQSFQQIDLSKIHDLSKEYLQMLSHPINQLQPGYANFIIAFHKKIHETYWFRKSLRKMPGFAPGQSLLQFIDQEAAQIKAARIAYAQTEARRQTYNHIHKDLTQRYTHARETHNQILINRHRKRIDALNTTIKHDGKQYDYSKIVQQYPVCSDPEANAFNNCYGTALDQQLHEELCETRRTVLHLQTHHEYNPHVQTFAPIIYRMTTLAKAEPNKLFAFNLADFAAELAHALSQTIKYTIAFGHRMVQGIKTSFNLEHWKDMAVGSMYLGIFLVNEFARYQQVDDSFLSLNFDRPNNNSIEAYEQQRRAQMQMIKDHARASLEKIKTMPWNELVGDATEIVSTLFADLITLKLVGSLAGKAGNILKTLIAELKSANSVAQESFAQVAGGTKLVLEEGVEASTLLSESTEASNAHVTSESKVFAQVEQETDTIKKSLAQKERGRAMSERGKTFERELVEKLGGKGSFKVKGTGTLGTREFDGATGNVWYEAKSSWKWLDATENAFSDFRSDIMKGLRIANENGAKYALHSKGPIPQKVKDWLTKKGIPFTEWE